MLTIKADDVVGRAKAFEAIVEGKPIPEATIPESFKVLVKELNSLGLDIIPIADDGSGVVISDDIDEAEIGTDETVVAAMVDDTVPPATADDDDDAPDTDEDAESDEEVLEEGLETLEGPDEQSLKEEE